MTEIFSRTADGHEIDCGWTLSRNFLEKVKAIARSKKSVQITDISLSNIETLLLAAEKVMGE